MCLCPLIISNQQILEIKSSNLIFKSLKNVSIKFFLANEALMTCQISLDSDFIAINSNSIMNSLFTIEIDHNPLYSDLQCPSIETFNAKLFPIQVCESK